MGGPKGRRGEELVRTDRHVFRSAGWTAAAQICSLGLWVGSSLMAARALGPEGNGELLLGINSVFIAGSITGLSVAGLISANLAAGRIRLKQTLRFATVHSVVAGCITALVLRALRWMPSGGASGFLFEMGGWVSMSAAVLVGLANFRAMLVGLSRIGFMNTQVLVTSAGNAVGWVICWRQGCGPREFFQVWSLAQVIGFIPCIVGLTWDREDEDANAGTMSFRSLFRMSLVLHWGTIALALLSRMVPFVIERVSNLAAVGLYAAGAGVANRVGLVAFALGTSLVGATGRSRNEDEAWSIVVKAGRRLVPLLLFVCVGLGVFAAPLLTLVLGKQYEGVSWIIGALLPGQFVYAILYALVQTFLLTRHNDVIAWSLPLWVGLFVMVPCASIGARFLGGAGGALGESAGYVVAFLASAKIVRKKYERSIIDLFVWK